MSISLVKRAVRKYRSDGVRSVIWTGLNLVPGGRLIKSEYKSWSDMSMPISKRIRLWKSGFLSQAAVLYDFETYNMSEYISDYQRNIRTQNINDEWRIALDNKLIFQRMLTEFESYLPEVYGVIMNNRFHSIPPGQVANEPKRAIKSLLENHNKIVLKPVHGGAGHGVLLCSSTAGGYDVNGEVVDEKKFDSIVDDFENYLVTEFVEQSSYSSLLYPNTVNTIRIITMIDPKTNKSFTATAVQRIGSNKSGGVDNWSQGGLSAKVDIDSGNLSEAAQYPYDGVFEYHTTHPDTGSEIEGRSIPRWVTVQETIEQIADSISFIPYVAWDVVHTEDSFKIIEANAYTDVDLLQVHEPLLTDQRIRRFYEHHDVIDQS